MTSKQAGCKAVSTRSDASFLVKVTLSERSNSVNVTNSYRITRIVGLALASIHFAALLALPLPAVAAGLSNNNGQQLYLVHCAGCHGTYGVSAIPDARNFSRVELMAQPDQNLLDLIRSGRNMMPGYLGILSDQDIMSIINHIRTLN